MFATIRSLIPEPRQADQPRHYVGRHRQPEIIATVAVVPAPASAPEAEAETAEVAVAPVPVPVEPGKHED
jgi:hypothetical protein